MRRLTFRTLWLGSASKNIRLRADRVGTEDLTGALRDSTKSLVDMNYRANSGRTEVLDAPAR